MSAIINENAPEAPTAGALGPVIAALLRREPADRPDAGAAARMITNVLPSLADQASDAPAGYEATALSASSRPGAPPSGPPGPVRPRLPQPGETSLDFASAEHTAAPPDPSAVRTGPQAGAPKQVAPTTSQPSQGSAGDASPDFSSWYDPAPRSAPAPDSGSGWSGPSAPSASQPGPGSGYPAPAGYGPAGYGPSGWSGQASQQAPAPQPWPGAEYAQPQRRRSGLGWKAAVAALAIIGAGAGAATVVLLHQNHSGSPPGGSSTSASTSTSASGSTGGTGGTLPPALLTTAINQPLTGPPPAGYKSLSKPATGTEAAGFTISYPANWTVTQKGLYQTWLLSPQAGVNMLVDLTPHTYPGDMVQEAQYIETQSIPHFPGYQRIDLKPLTIRGTPGSFWKFTWTDNGVKQEALDFLFIQDNQSYALYATAPASVWNQLQATFDEEVRSFAPQP
jgi:hypothetical protein